MFLSIRMPAPLDKSSFMYYSWCYCTLIEFEYSYFTFLITFFYTIRKSCSILIINTGKFAPKLSVVNLYHSSEAQIFENSSARWFSL